jgi:hypothetical protein
VRRRVETQPFWSEVVNRSGREPEFVGAWRDGRWALVEYKAAWDSEDVVVVGAEYLGVFPPWVRIVVAKESELETSFVAAWDSARAARAGLLGEQRSRAQGRSPMARQRG